MMPNQSSAFAAPRRTVESAAVASSAIGNSMGRPFWSLMSGTKLSNTSMTTKLVSNSWNSASCTMRLRASHTVHAASGAAGHAIQGRAFR